MCQGGVAGGLGSPVMGHEGRLVSGHVPGEEGGGDGTAGRLQDTRVRAFVGQSRHRDLVQRGSATKVSRAT